MKRLIVLVPAITGNTRRWQPLMERLQHEADLRGSTWLPWDHHVWRTQGPFDENGGSEIYRNLGPTEAIRQLSKPFPASHQPESERGGNVGRQDVTASL